MSDFDRTLRYTAYSSGIVGILSCALIVDVTATAGRVSMLLSGLNAASLIYYLSCRFESEFPENWGFLRFLMSRQMRERIFLPAFYEIQADHLETQQQRAHSPLVSAWMQFCYAFRIALTILNCMRVGATARVVAILLALLPFGLKQWVRELWIVLFR